MESAIRWSHVQNDNRRFLVADVAANRLQYCQVDGYDGNKVKHSILLQRDRLPNFTAFEWCRHDESLVAIGTSAGECRIVSIEDGSDVHAFPVKLQRKCNSVSFSSINLIAVGLDRTRGDSSLNVHDLVQQGGQKGSEPYRRLAGAEVITNVKFFNDQPNLLVAGSGGIARHGQTLKLFDLRDNSSKPPVIVTTRHVHLLSIDPMDENYFVSAAPANENAVSVWDKRWLLSPSASAVSAVSQMPAALEIKPVFDPDLQPQIWSVRYSGYERGVFAAMSSAGHIKVFETARLHEDQAPKTVLYVRRSSELRAANETSAEDEDLTAARPVSFDFAQMKPSIHRPCVITIRKDKRIGSLDVPPNPPVTECSTQQHFLACERDTSSISSYRSIGTIADDVEALRRAHGQSKKALKEENWLPNYERHKRLLNLPAGTLTFHELALLGDVPRRRCKEGYLFDCEKNQSIVKDDNWLSGLWQLIQRIKKMASNGGMMHKGLDFSFFGVADLWFARFGGNPERLGRRGSPTRKEFAHTVTALLGSQSYPAFEGASTEYPGLRQLGLAICGHRFDEKRLREKCSQIISRKDYYKAIVVAVYHDRKDVAIELLKTLTRSKAMKDSGLAAVIVCKTISDEQRDLCQWMAEEAEDPYLRALLAYFVSGTWRTIAEMAELPLIYRVAVALKYFQDDELDDFLTDVTNTAIAKGDPEGVVLTGLADSSMDLFQNYIVKFDDVQTAVLATAFTNPRYVRDSRFELWTETYFAQMQSWATFIERVRFRAQHERMNVNRSGQKPTPTPTRTRPPVQLRCKNCQKSFFKGTDRGTDSMDTRQRSNKGKAAPGSGCPHCGKPFSRCSICLLWQGAPRAAQPASDPGSVEEENMGGMIGFCMRCKHGWHPHHGREWFSKHRECPVAGCDCYCRLLNEPFLTPAG